MGMEGSRRSFDRSREPGMKKPRLTNELERVPNSSVRPFPPRLVASGVNTPLASAMLRTNDRDFETSDSGLIGYRPQQPGLYEELVTQYKTALAELTFNSKPIITNLTIIAGENLYAAKAIAATVCANILEVPSEQKLPSLYLLDSIVKNIGQDYIKHFAARLPEVFCKAYELVDPSVHPSMRHLFGTWKGVFPSQTLQMIEKELGLTPAANVSSSASSTLRSDLQSQHPPQSIHVNPKYLERKHLQSSRTKGIANDMIGVVANSTEDVERPNRALGAGQPWVDSAVNIRNVEHSQRDAFVGSVTEKTIGTSYGGNEYGSDLSRNLSLGTGRTGGRVSELGHDKSWHEVGRGIAETISGQRNGFGIKHSFSNHEAPKSMTMDTHQRSAESLASMRSSVMSVSWKNSEEEEYMWDDMNSGSTDHGASNVSSNLCKDSWRADDEKLAVEDHLQVPCPFEAKVHREISTASTAPLSTEKKQAPTSGHYPSLSWQLQEQHSIDEVNRQSGRSEGFASTLGLSISANSYIGRMGNQPFLPKEALGSLGMVGQQKIPSTKSPSGQSTLIQQSLSHQVGSRLGPHQLKNSAEGDHLQTLKTSQFLGGPKSQSIQDASPVLPSNVQVGNLRRSQQKDLQGSISSVTSFQPRDHNAISKHQQVGSSGSEVSNKTEKLPVSKTSLPGETSEQPTTSSLLAAVMKSGVFSNNSTATSLPNLSFMDHEILPSQSGILPGLDGSSPTTSISLGLGVSSPTSLGPSPNNDLCTPHTISQEKVGKGQPPRLPASSTVSSASALVCATNPISNLLSSLVAKGLISAKTESPTIVSAEVLTQLQDRNQSIASSTSSLDSSDPGAAAGPVSSTGDEVDHTAKGCIALSQSVHTEIRNLIGFEFKPDVIRELHPPVINELLDDFPHHCSNCGLRLKYQEQFDKHFNWHATREREQNDLIRPSRGWYVKSSDWIAGKDEFKSKYTNTVDIDDKETDESEPVAMVPADENQCLCVLCGELFEDVYCQEKDKWMFKGAIYMTMSYSYGEMDIGKVSTAGGPIIHAECLQEISISSILKMEQD